MSKLSFPNILSEIGPAFAIAGALFGTIEADAAEFAAGQTIDVPQIRTYVAGKHVAIDIKVSQIQDASPTAIKPA